MSCELTFLYSDFVSLIQLVSANSSAFEESSLAACEIMQLIRWSMGIETLEMKTTLSFVTSETTYPAKQRHIPDDQNL